MARPARFERATLGSASRCSIQLSYGRPCLASGSRRPATFSAENGKGLQIGFWNVAKEMTGLQIGLLNFNDKGFLPIFPLFNFGY